MSQVRDKLENDVGTTGWGLLDPHFRRDTLFLVDETLELVDVAVAVAEDRTAQVEAWIGTGQLARPTAEQAAHWAGERGPAFRFVIVQPFVLAQRLPPPRS